MKKMKDAIKTISLYALRLLFSPFLLLPMKKTILFCANSGAGFLCNPKYLYLNMVADPFFKEYKLIWCFKEPDRFSRLKKEYSNTVVCKYRSLKYYYYRITSKVVITNSIEGTECPKHKKQIKIQTWHGGGSYKKVALLEKMGSSFLKNRTKRNMKDTDWFVSSSRLFSKEVIRVDFGYTGKIIESGMPRNDILFNDEKIQLSRRKIVEELKLKDHNFIVLYAPTWRYENDKIENFDPGLIKDAFMKKFGREVTILYRQHVYMKRRLEGLVDVTKYPDMQELMMASDALISDYSSCIWDYSFLNKPCFLFCPDLKKYLGERGFILDIYRWGFPVAENSEELEREIRQFNEIAFKRAMKKHHEELGSFEEGCACEKVITALKKTLKK